MRAPILALLLLALASSRQAFAAETTDTIEAMQANCLSATSTPAWSAGADTAACELCVQNIGNLDGLTSNRMYACYDVCQSADLFANGGTTASECITCISDPLKTVQACKDCMSTTADAACRTCLEADPFQDEILTQATQYKRDQYFYACAQCSKIPAGPARDQCYECISTADARLRTEGGILTLAETLTPGFEGRDNDFGACVFLANQSYLISIGSEAVTGIYATCVPEEDEDINLSIADCINCMADVETLQANAFPNATFKSYGCADYCQNPASYPTGLNEGQIADLAEACVTCLLDDTVSQAWACGNCLKTAVPFECFDCVETDPYAGNTSNFNWACGQCAQVTDPALRALCFTCIRSQPGAGDGQINNSTEANICSCIDLVANNAIDVSRPLTAMERTCFEPFQYYDSNNVLQTPDIPWGDDKLGTNNSECLNCMRIASDPEVQGSGINKAYACHEYCQNPDLVADEEQGLDCALCVINPLVSDPWACQVCMTASSETTKRQDCFTCVASDSVHPNHAWGCGQCAQFSNDDAATACYQCLATDALDPCECVDGVKNGTITPAPQAAPVPEVVCQLGFASLVCPYNPITEEQSVITGIDNLFFGRHLGDYTTCPGSCLDRNYCPTRSLVPGTPIQECSATASRTSSVEARANRQCVGRASCNIGEYTVNSLSDIVYGLSASGLVFGTTSNPLGPCPLVRKYLEYTYTCSDVGL